MNKEEIIEEYKQKLKESRDADNNWWKYKGKEQKLESELARINNIKQRYSETLTDANYRMWELEKIYEALGGNIDDLQNLL